MSLAPETAIERTGAEASRELISRLREYTARIDSSESREFVRFAARLRETDLLAWLEAQEVVAKYYWRSRDMRTEFAALVLPRFGLSLPTTRAGALAYSNENADVDSTIQFPTPLRAFNNFSFSGDWRFDAELRAVPSPLPFLLPDIELVSTAEATWLICTLQHHAEAKLLQEGIEGLDWNLPLQFSLPRVVTREETQSRLQWAVAVNRAIAAIERKELEKVVLARRSVCRFDNRLSPWAVLQRLRGTNPGCYVFGVDCKPFDAFVGASPERLYYRQGRKIVTEALAGTRPRGKNIAEESRYREDLLHSSKERNEHDLVVRGIAESLSPLTEKIDIQTEPTVVPLANVQHLVVKIQATLRTGIGDDDLLRALQPTPAVGGYPRDRAVNMIRLLEPFDRGPYAGAVGWISSDSAEFTVGIRSGVIKEDQLILYGGAGIVQGSDPDAEWDEIDQKFDSYASILIEQ